MEPRGIRAEPLELQPALPLLKRASSHTAAPPRSGSGGGRARHALSAAQRRLGTTLHLDVYLEALTTHLVRLRTKKGPTAIASAI